MNTERHDHEAAKALYAKPTTTDAPARPTSTDGESLRAEQRRELVMTTLWQRMAEIFGNQWELNFGKPGGASYCTWREGLAGYSEAQIKNGLEQCRLWESAFIPHLGQFAKLCLTKRNDGPTYTEQRIAREGNVPLLERLKHNARTPIAKEAIERMSGEIEETFEESYHRLGLQHRWGPLPKNHHHRTPR